MRQTGLCDARGVFTRSAAHPWLANDPSRGHAPSARSPSADARTHRMSLLEPRPQAVRHDPVVAIAMTRIAAESATEAIVAAPSPAVGMRTPHTTRHLNRRLRLHRQRRPQAGTLWVPSDPRKAATGQELARCPSENECRSAERFTSVLHDPVEPTDPASQLTPKEGAFRPQGRVAPTEG